MAAAIYDQTLCPRPASNRPAAKVGHLPYLLPPKRPPKGNYIQRENDNECTLPTAPHPPLPHFRRPPPPSPPVESSGNLPDSRVPKEGQHSLFSPVLLPSLRLMTAARRLPIITSCWQLPGTLPT